MRRIRGAGKRDEGETRLEGGEGLRRGAEERTKVKESDRGRKRGFSGGTESCPRKRSVGAAVPVRIALSG